MQYRRFGRTEINLPVISVGGMRYQTSWKREDAVKAESVTNLQQIVARAMENGLNHFETAHGYGTSEEELGQVLRDYDRDQLILQTKGGPKEDVREFLKNLESSLTCLQTDRLDLFAVHGINNDAIMQQALVKGGVVEAALKLKEEGVIGHLGFSTHGPLETILPTIQTGLFDYVNLWYFYINQWNWPAIEAATQRDMGVFIISPNDKGGKLYDPPQKWRDLTAPLHPMAFNDLFLLSHPQIHTLSCGVARAEDFDIHLEAVNQMAVWQDAIKKIQARLDAELAGVLDDDWPEHYRDGLPAWEATPGGLNIPVILWLWNLVRAFDMTEYARMRYNLMGNAEHWFPGARPDSYGSVDRNALRLALERSPYRDRIMTILDEAHQMLYTGAMKRLSESE